jgi:hypothetical protein
MEAGGLISNDPKLEKEVISFIKQTYQKHGVDMSRMKGSDWQEVIKKIESAALSCWLTDGQKKVHLDFLDKEVADGLKKLGKLITGIEKLKLNDTTSGLAKALAHGCAEHQEVIEDTLLGLTKIKEAIDKAPDNQLNSPKGRPPNPAKTEFAFRVYSILFETFGETPPVWKNEDGLVSPFVTLLDQLYSELISKLGIPVGKRVSSLDVAEKAHEQFKEVLESHKS